MNSMAKATLLQELERSHMPVDEKRVVRDYVCSIEEYESTREELEYDEDAAQDLAGYMYQQEWPV